MRTAQHLNLSIGQFAIPTASSFFAQVHGHELEFGVAAV